MTYLNKIKTLAWRTIRIHYNFRSFPKNFFIVLTSPRSGSTWFSDAIRCHPMIQYSAYGVVYALLGLSGRRYPRDLTDGVDAMQTIEVLPFQWGKIPSFNSLEGYKLPADESFLIEKCHPEFFGFDTVKFINKIEQLKTGNVKIKFIYQVRDPEATIVSFMNYQERNPKWYPSLNGGDLAAYMHKTFASIHELALQEPGLIVDFADIMGDLESVLKRVYSHVWPALRPAEDTYIHNILHNAKESTARHRRPQSTFLGEKTGSIKGGGNKYEDFFDQYRDDIKKCYDSYEALLNLRQ